MSTEQQLTFHYVFKARKCLGTFYKNPNGEWVEMGGAITSTHWFVEGGDWVAYFRSWSEPPTQEELEKFEARIVRYDNRIRYQGPTSGSTP